MLCSCFWVLTMKLFFLSWKKWTLWHPLKDMGIQAGPWIRTWLWGVWSGSHFHSPLPHSPKYSPCSIVWFWLESWYYGCSSLSYKMLSCLLWLNDSKISSYYFQNLDLSGLVSLQFWLFLYNNIYIFHLILK